MPKKYQPTYWSGKGKYHKLYDQLYGAFVPSMGEASNECGELIRCATNLYYDIYNNGACNFGNYESERKWLVRHMPSQLKNASRRFVHKPTYAERHDEKYQKFLDLYMDAVILHADLLLQASKMEE